MSRIHRIVCDGCGSEEDLEKRVMKIPKSSPIGIKSPGRSGGKKGTVRFNLPDGWRKIQGRDVCPSCGEEVEDIISGDSDE